MAGLCSRRVTWMWWLQGNCGGTLRAATAVFYRRIEIWPRSIACGIPSAKGSLGIWKGLVGYALAKLVTAYYSEDMGADVQGLGLVGAAIQGRRLMGREDSSFHS